MLFYYGPSNQIHLVNLVFKQVGLAVVNGQLYAVGGFDGTTYLKNVETFDQEVTNTVLDVIDIVDYIPLNMYLE